MDTERQQRPAHQLRRRTALTVLIVALFGTAALHAQAPSMSLSTVMAPKADAAPAAAADTRPVRLLVGRSTIVNVGSPIARISVTSADIADVLVTAPSEVLVNGKAPGTISMFVWNRGGAVTEYEVVVQRDLNHLTAQLRRLFPGESIDVQTSGKDVVLSGKVSNKDVSEKAVNLAAGYVAKKEEVVSLLQLREGAPSNQVLLRVRFAEVSRNALTELGASYYADGYKGRVGSVTTQQFPSPFFDQQSPMVGERQVFSDFLNLFMFDLKNQLGGVIKALSQRGLFQTLAEPNLVAESGKEASFLAGGEFPIPIAQGSGGGVAISVQFKEFGIRLSFTPVVNGDRVHLKVRPEVSTLDFNNAVVLQGFRIPALSTRRTETELELQNGQTFAIAGLLNNTMVSSMRKIPGIGDIPILGLLFRSKAAQKDQTELVVMITPEILPNNSNGVTPNLPRLAEPFLAPLTQKQSQEPPAPAFGPAAAAQTAAPAQRADGNQQSPAAAAAATVSAMSPLNRAPTVHVGATAPAPSAPAPAATPEAAPASTVTRPLTPEERKQVERARTEELKRRGAETRAQAAEAKRASQLAEEQRRKQKIEEARQAKLPREQAKRDGEQARRMSEQAKKQAEIDKEKQKAVAAAEVKLKAAQAAYQAELAKQER